MTASTTPAALDIYGVGNAIVDLLLKVDDVDLETLRLRKGGMQLVSAAEQMRLHGKLGGREATTIAGGSAANTIAAAAQLGSRTAYACSIGRDKFGTTYTSGLAALGVDVHASIHPDEPTGTSLILITPDGERTMNTCLAASAALAPQAIDATKIASATWLYVEGYLLTATTTRAAAFAAMDAAKAAGRKVAFSFSDGFVVSSHRSDVERIVREYADLVFANAAEAAALTGHREPADNLYDLTSMGTDAYITMSEAGAWVGVGGIYEHIPAEATQALDATGAGDAFAAGVLHALARGADPRVAARLGHSVAHRVVRTLGPRLSGDLRDLAHRALGVSPRRSPQSPAPKPSATPYRVYPRSEDRGGAGCGSELF